MQSPDLGFQDGSLQIGLKDPTGEEQLLLLEHSTDMVSWSPVARNYGFEWEHLFPDPLPIFSIEGGQILEPDSTLKLQFFRISGSATAPQDRLHLVSRFLQQATFGPTRDLINSFPGLNSSSLFNAYPYPFFEEWIDAQMALEVTSLRKFWRERSNPAFTDNSANSPFEVGHNPALGTQLPYWLDGQTLIKPNPADAVNAGRNSNDVSFSPVETKQIVWYQAAITAPDGLRQRVAWALSQIFVLGENGSVQLNATERFLVYYDIFLRHAYGNFRDILGEVTFNPCMGDYLTFLDNRKANPDRGTFPDENYAREVMQLFTIGLWMLNLDGTYKTDTNGNRIPTYDNDDILTFASVFTGLRKKETNRPGIGTGENIEIKFGNFVDPMRMQASRHDFTEKTLLDGTSIGPFPATDQGGIDEINAVLDHLFDHPNTPPFIARRLIQRLTLSNPSPAYIRDVAQAFIDGQWNGSGSGDRGDLRAVWKAILLHPEAREPALYGDPAHGKLREPLVRLLHYARAFEITSPQTYGFFPFNALNQVIAQSPFDSPSVFNFYLPDYQPTGDIQDRGLFSPEFEITTDVTSLALANAIRTLVNDGISNDIGRRRYSQGNLDLSYEISIAHDIDALVAHLDLLLTAGRLTPENRQVLIDFLNELPDVSIRQKQDRVHKALSLISLFPEFNILY